MTDIGEITSSSLMDELASDSPGVTMSTVRNTGRQSEDNMEAGTSTWRSASCRN